MDIEQYLAFVATAINKAREKNDMTEAVRLLTECAKTLLDMVVELQSKGE